MKQILMIDMWKSEQAAVDALRTLVNLMKNGNEHRDTFWKLHGLFPVLLVMKKFSTNWDSVTSLPVLGEVSTGKVRRIKK